jgi:hydroxymethylbilane synthase
MTAPLRIGTRGSRLALWQARHVADLIRPALGDRHVEIVEIKTTGDQLQDAALATIGGQGVFTKELQQALRDGRCDLAVHSLKDLPTEPVPGVILAAVPARAPTGDAFVSLVHRSFDTLPPGATVATSSTRRSAQMLHRRPDLRLVNIRGNVDTRIRKLREEGLDAVILAVAGLERLGWDGQITEVLDQSWMLPAVGQGALGLECRLEDLETQRLALGVDHPPSRAAIRAERAFLHAMGGGCLLPIAGLAVVDSDSLSLRGSVCSPDGKQRLDGVDRGPLDEAESVGQRLAARMLDRGARALLVPAPSNG